MKRICYIPVFTALFLTAQLLFASGEKADLVVVRKSEHQLYLMKEGGVLKKFHVALGKNPEGPKAQEGDLRTPEGNYILDQKRRKSRYYRAIHISYPNGADRAAAKEKGVDPGNMIMIHGQRNGLGWLAFYRQKHDWTDGCIAVTDSDMDLIWKAVDEGTPIQILP